MSWASTISRSISTPNQSSRDGRKVNGWIIHHNAATGGAGVLELMRSGSKQVSANYQVMQGGEVVGVVARENRSWSASNAAWDGSSLTFEIANNSGAPGWTISEGAYQSVARTIAEDSIWAGIPINRTTVRGHREGSAQGAGGSYSTACPGGIDLDRLVNLANQYRGGASVAGSGGVALPNTSVTENEMIHYLAVSSNKIIGAGQRFVQGADGPLRVLGVGEWSVIEHNFPDVKPAEWSADQLVELIGRVGLREYDTNGPSGIGRLTGRVLYGVAEGDRGFPRTAIVK